MNEYRAKVELSAESVERTAEWKLIKKFDPYVVQFKVCFIS